MDLITGATGYVGSRLLERLVEEGRPVRALARDPDRVTPSVQTVQADLLEDVGLARALRGIDTAYYLVHSMSGPAIQGFDSRDRIAATNFARAARAAGVERVVYLGGVVPASGDRLSPHLASRLEVERILLESAPRATALRASIIVGARSSSFRILVRLVERLRLLPFPSWRDHRTCPIDERDALEYLARTPAIEASAGQSLDIAGPDLLSYGEMIERIADVMGVARVPVKLGVAQTPTAAAVVARITGQPLGLVRPLMESLQYELLPRDDRARRLYGVRPHAFDRAVEHALRDWERSEELTAR